jgi:hypothetical protein
VPSASLQSSSSAELQNGGFSVSWPCEAGVARDCPFRKAMNNERRSHRVVLALSFVPPVIIAGAFVFISFLWPFSAIAYEHHRQFWGGNPSEVFSHWLDAIVMSGNAFSLGWFVSLAAFTRRWNTPGSITRWLKGTPLVCLVASVLTAATLDSKNGEGTVMYVTVLGFIPVLGSWSYLLRKAASFLSWVPARILALSVLYIVLNFAAQFFYEPSGTGGPNGLFVLVWLGSLALAAVVAFGIGLRSGTVLRFCTQAANVVRKPIVWGSSLLLFLGIAIPLTVHARRLHQPRQALAMKWLDDIEASLSDQTVNELKDGAIYWGTFNKMPVPERAHALLGDPRIGPGSSLRIYIPLADGRYLFLWSNSSFDYCDVRPLGNARRETVEMDQNFIDALCEHQGTYGTGAYSGLWGPYLAGRVLKTGSGEVKAICVIKSPD